MRALRSIPVLVVLTLAAVLTPVVPVAAAPSGPAPSSSLSWKGCGGGFQCATLAVPVDASTSAPTLDLAVIRARARDAGSAHRHAGR